MHVATIAELSLSSEAKNELTYAQYVQVGEFLDKLASSRDNYLSSFKATIAETEKEAIDMLGEDIVKFFYQRYSAKAVPRALQFRVSVQEVKDGRFYARSSVTHGYNYPVSTYVHD